MRHSQIWIDQYWYARRVWGRRNSWQRLLVGIEDKGPKWEPGALKVTPQMPHLLCARIGTVYWTTEQDLASGWSKPGRTHGWISGLCNCGVVVAAVLRPIRYEVHWWIWNSNNAQPNNWLLRLCSAPDFSELTLKIPLRSWGVARLLHTLAEYVKISNPCLPRHCGSKCRLVVY
jgi:hypothetical protein